METLSFITDLIINYPMNISWCQH